MTEQPSQKPLTVAQEVLDQIAATAKAAAKEIDAGAYNLDDRIKAMHRLWALSVQGWAAWVQAAVSGPGFSVKWDAAPAPSEPIPVAADPKYRRNIEVTTSFTQVGDPSTVIPNNQIKFIPPVLDAGATQFQIAVMNPDLSGRAYTGEVRLTAITPAGTPPGQQILPIPDVEL
ncbi:hypothetical protein [Mycobacterium noviomagense]|uniref:Uncharacterized protein n=1 Tax=Mycobacterium noviomagense TaxID=459858 RepID=A0A7I7PHE4_9MYCO|nr:hypothetical protein [Mycobacterium noviomagense]ORB14642.1 hypothetical protein BST37_10890 [Mycobacterium noviomagense]BBY08048.1 hypothetical protein MNVI_33660 [Mycobacterium noviomagense]